MVKAGLQVVWFKRDLRVDDHRPLARASRAGPVLPLYVAERELWQEPDMSARQWAFIAECLADLREDLAALGQPLVVRTGDIVDILSAIRMDRGITALWSHEETGNAWTYKRDLRVKAWCRENGVPWHEEPQTGVIRRIASRNGWAKRWDSFMAEPMTPAAAALPPIAGMDVGHIPSALDLGLEPDPCPCRQRGGREIALETLQSFLHERGETYRRDMSSPVTGFGGCSRLSPYLAHGALSMREVTQAAWARQRALKTLPKDAVGGWRGSMVSFSGRLHWHCHFMQKLEDEPRLEFENLHRGYDGARPKEPDATRLAAWEKGETGLPFVDATMRALNATGWMNFRMRAMLMAVASYHLWLDWRRPGEHLARAFTDYEPGIHWPQVQMQSGTTGINTVRIYNPIKQGHDQDTDGVFVRRWVPELKDVPEEFIHEPWKWEKAGTVLGKTYPEPIIDHLTAAKEARQRIWAARKGPAFRAEANRIQDKHGSRKSGMPVTGQKRGKPARRRTSAKPGEQSDLDLADGAAE